MKENFRSGKLVTVRKVQDRKVKVTVLQEEKWLCKCDCGNDTIVITNRLYYNNAKSCGCHDYKNKSHVDDPNYIEIMKNNLINRSKKNEKGCLEWQGTKHRQGYGYIRFQKKNILTHRLSWKLFKGDLDDSVLVCHHCDNPSCINPDHLFLGTYKDNNQDRAKKKRNNTSPYAYTRKLKYDQVLEIRKLSEKGIVQKKIAKRFNVNQQCISKILNGKSWKINWDEQGVT